MSTPDELVKIVEGASKPVNMAESNPHKNNDFFLFTPDVDILGLDDRPLESVMDFGKRIKYTRSLIVPPDVKQLVLLSRDMCRNAHERNPDPSMYGNMTTNLALNKQGNVYVTGGILFGDKESLERLGSYFDVKSSKALECKHIDQGGMIYLFGLKELDDAVQFASRGEEWATSPGYAHLCLGHIPKIGSD